MNLKKEFEPIREWATEKGITQKATSQSQYLKLIEEIGELSRAIQKNDQIELIDAIGDSVVVLTNLATLNGLNIEDCINSAYQVIKNRQGITNSFGIFVKE